MPALVPELVNMASDPAISTADLLRRALVVARRLAVPELVDWINAELNGYGTVEVPDYRRVQGDLVAESPIHGPVPFLAPQFGHLLTDFSNRQSIPELIHLRNSNRPIGTHFPPEVERTLMHMMRESMGVAMRPALMFSAVQVEGIIETVRSRILDWALDLEGRGIIGEGMSFTPQEKQAVQQQHYHFGNVSGSQIQIGSNGSTQTQANTTAGTDLESLKGLVQALGTMLADAKGDTADELRAELATLKAQADSPKPKWEIIKATARSIKAVAEGAAGGLIAGLAQPHMATLLALAAA